MKITVHNTRCSITEFPPSPYDKALIKEFTRKSANTFWAQKNVKGWTGATHFISAKKGMFSSGLLPLILAWAKKQEIDVELDDQRIVPKAGTTFVNKLNTYTLRDYQEEAVKAAIKEHRGIIKVPTGGGKTLIAASIIQTLKLDTLFIVERINLATQTKQRWVEQYGLDENDIGIVGGSFEESDKKVVITTIQSVHKLTDLDRFDVVILDEMHHAKAQSYISFLKNMDKCYYRFGLSGTPFGGDPVEDMYRVAQFGPIIYELKTQTLIDEGVLSKPTIRMIEISKPNVDYMSPYLAQYKEAVANNRYRNFIICKFARELKGKTLILFKLIEHGTNLRERLPQALYIDGNTPAMTRDYMLNEFYHMDRGIMLASTVVDEGIDFSSMENLIVAGGEKSAIKGIQRLGRGLRAKEKGDTVNVIDFYDDTCSTLLKHSRKRMKLYKEEGHTVKLFKLSDEDAE